MNDWLVYIIECDDGSLYTGITNHLPKRWHAHCNGTGAKFFRSRRPKQVVWCEYSHDRSSASQREYQIKQLSRLQKLDLIKPA